MPREFYRAPIPVALDSLRLKTCLALILCSFPRAPEDTDRQQAGRYENSRIDNEHEKHKQITPD